MKQEKSCGAVLFRGGFNRTYLILHSTRGHHTLCKGHVESDETEHETAVREIGEETGLRVEFIDGFREVITYSLSPDRVKDVVFFLAKALDGPVICQPDEVADASFLPLEQALERLTHTSDREVLSKADRFLQGG